MANNKLYGYTPKSSNEKEGNRLDRLNPYEFRKGMDYELTLMGISRLAESTIEERETATEKVIKNLQEYGAYYSALIQYETEYRNPVEGQSKPSFKSYLQEIEDYHMIEVDKTFSNDKMTEPKYKKEDHTIPFKTAQLKEAIKKEIRKSLNEDKDDDFDEKEPTKAQLKGIDKSIGDTKEALAQAQKKVKELAPDIKKLAKEVNDKIKKNPANKADYLKVYQSDPDVKAFIKLRKMLKSADLL